MTWLLETRVTETKLGLKFTESPTIYVALSTDPSSILVADACAACCAVAKSAGRRL